MPMGTNQNIDTHLIAELDKENGPLGLSRLFERAGSTEMVEVPIAGRVGAYDEVLIFPKTWGILPAFLRVPNQVT
jgi:hypothetical protein